MAIIDVSGSDLFLGSSFEFSASINESKFRGFYTGNTQRNSTLSDRMTGLLTLPYTKDKRVASMREAMIMSMKSRGDLIRMGAPHRQNPVSMRGSVAVVSGNYLAGARAISIAGVLSGVNAIFGSGFESDANADGLADGWTLFSQGTTGTLTPQRFPGFFSIWGQQINASNLGTGIGDRAGILYQQKVSVQAGDVWTLAADAIDSGVPVRLYLDWFDVGDVIISTSTILSPSNSTNWRRIVLTATAPAGAVSAAFYIWCEQRPFAAGNASFKVDNVQFERGSVATTYSGLAYADPGDFFSVGGNLLQVGLVGGVATDMGLIGFSLTYPLPKALSNGAQVVLQNPTGLWEWDGDSPTFSYMPGNIAAPVVLPLRQVIL